jgi:(E)-4-hydroxy-3-methylbut-2-enyl-diphosphate synthase
MIGGDNLPIIISDNRSEGRLTPDIVADFKSDDRHFFDDYDFKMICKANQLDEIAPALHHEEVVIIIQMESIGDGREVFNKLHDLKCDAPVILKKCYQLDSLEDLQIRAAGDLGSFFMDGLGDGIWLENQGNISQSDVIETAFGILQAAGARISKTEYISCPTCGRTKFNIQQTLANIKKSTSHLMGLKIAVMGCVVNGPGEMADADYGYVGAGPGKVNLYKGKEVRKNNVPEKEAVHELIQLIKDNGQWTD